MCWGSGKGNELERWKKWKGSKMERWERREDSEAASLERLVGKLGKVGGWVMIMWQGGKCRRVVKW